MTLRRTDPHQELLDDARQADAVASRTQRRLLQEADEQDATFRGSLEDAAESGLAIVVETTVGRRLSGQVRALAADHVVLEGEHGTAWIALSAVGIVRATRAPHVRAGGGERPARPSVPLAVALRRLAEERAELEVVLAATSVVRGTATAVGRDVLALRERGTGTRLLLHLPRAQVVLHLTS